MRHPSLQAFFFLLAGLFFYYFTQGNSSFALAAWLYPFCWLQVARKYTRVWPAIVLPLAAGLCSLFSLRGFTHDSPGNILFYIPFIGGALIGLLFWADRYLHNRVPRFLSALCFPLLYTAFEFSVNLLNPFGTTGLLGYSQADFPCFAQLASVTGIWGISFMLTWFAAVMQQVMTRHVHRLRTVAVYLAALSAVLIYGSIRLLIPLKGETVRIAGIHVYDREKEADRIWDLLQQGDKQSFRGLYDSILKRLTIETGIQARAGAQIVVWAELSPVLLQEDEDSLLVCLRQLAASHHIYLLASPYRYSPRKKKSVNKTLLLSPGGQLLLEHLKYGGSFAEETVAGSGEIKTVLTEFGRLSAIICWDADFPSVVRQAGKNHTDILLLPSSDWKAISPAHTRVAVFRGIENGCSVVRQTQNGRSLITDPRGKVLAEMDHYAADRWVMTGEVPVKGLFALYPYTGDIFGWLSVAGSLCIILLAITRRNK